MSDTWKQWEGQVVANFGLGRYLGGSDHSAVFLTERLDGGQPGAQPWLTLLQSNLFHYFLRMPKYNFRGGGWRRGLRIRTYCRPLNLESGSWVGCRCFMW